MLLQNQFTQLPVLGQLDMRLNIQSIQVQVDSSQATPLVAGQPVKLKTGTPQGGLPRVVACTGDDDLIYGFVNYDPKINSYSALQAMSISWFKGNVMYMVAGAAFDRNVNLAIDYTTPGNVNTATTGQTIIGTPMDVAEEAGDLVRVLINLPGAASA